MTFLYCALWCGIGPQCVKGKLTNIFKWNARFPTLTLSTFSNKRLQFSVQFSAAAPPQLLLKRQFRETMQDSKSEHSRWQHHLPAKKPSGLNPGHKSHPLHTHCKKFPVNQNIMAILTDILAACSSRIRLENTSITKRGYLGGVQWW